MSNRKKATLTAADLRDLAMSRVNNNHPQHVVIDDDLRQELLELRVSLAQLEEKRAELVSKGQLPEQEYEKPEPESLADTPEDPVVMKPQIDQLIGATREAIAAAEQEARDAGVVLTLNFRRLTPDAYQAQVDAATVDSRRSKERNGDTNQEFLTLLGKNLLAVCYQGATNLDGEDLGLTLDDLQNGVLDHADLANLRQHCIRINRAGSTIPFGLGNSGLSVGS